MSVVEREQVVELVEVRVWTKGDVLRRAAEIACTSGVYRGSNGCVLTRLAQAHHEITGEPIFWSEAGKRYFGAMFETVYRTNDGRFGSKGRRKDWATNLLLSTAAKEDAA